MAGGCLHAQPFAFRTQTLIKSFFCLPRPPQVTAALRYNATFTAFPELPAAKEPVTWTVTVRRPAPVPEGTELPLLCSFYGGEAGTLTDSDASYYARAQSQATRVVMAAGSSSVTCGGTVAYPRAGNYTARVQVFVANSSAVYGMCGSNSPARSGVLTVSGEVGSDGRLAGQNLPSLVEGLA